MAEYDELAEKIVDKVGGSENISGLTHCATRLKFRLKDEGRADTKALKTMRGVVTVLTDNGQYHVVIGTNAPEVYRLILSFAGLEKGKEKGTGDVGADGFFPYILAFAVGLFTALTIWWTGIPENFTAAFQVVLLSGSALIAGFLVLFFWKKKKREADEAPEVQKHQVIAGARRIASPVNGRLLPLAEVRDRALAEGALGEGIAVFPTEGKVFAPADGKITALFPDGHAIGMTTEQGIKLLIHIGIGTGELQGRCFRPKIVQNEIVSKGKLLLEFDLETIQKEGYDITTSVILANAGEVFRVHPFEKKTVKAGEDILWIEPVEEE